MKLDVRSLVLEFPIWDFVCMAKHTLTSSDANHLLQKLFFRDEPITATVILAYVLPLPLILLSP